MHVVNPIRALPLLPLGEGKVATPPADSAFAPLRLYRSEPGGECIGSTSSEEAGLLVLGGTFDVQAAGNGWGSRGARSDPFAGRPVAIFLPPHAPFAARGQGEILVLGAVPPPPVPVTGREALGKQPLLQMAGSGKAFDPTTGEWKLHEEFASAAQAILPRHIERSDAGGIAVERVFAPGYKSRGLCVDELVVPEGKAFRLTALPDRPARARELMLFVRPRGNAELRAGAAATRATADAVFVIATADAGDLSLTASGGPCYAVLGWAGK